MTGTANVATGGPKHRARRGGAPTRLVGPAAAPCVRRQQAGA